MKKSIVYILFIGLFGLYLTSVAHNSPARKSDSSLSSNDEFPWNKDTLQNIYDFKRKVSNENFKLDVDLDVYAKSLLDHFMILQKEAYPKKNLTINQQQRYDAFLKSLDDAIRSIKPIVSMFSRKELESFDKLNDFIESEINLRTAYLRARQAGVFVDNK